MKGQACFLSKAVMRSSVLGKNGDGEGVFQQALPFARTDAAQRVTTSHYQENNRRVCFPMWQERAGNWIELGQVDF